METDFDLVRNLALTLEGLERSPPEAIILGFADLSSRFGCTPLILENAFERLTELGIIEGPGQISDHWLFRRVTAKGTIFLAEIRDERRWQQIKKSYQIS